MQTKQKDLKNNILCDPLLEHVSRALALLHKLGIASQMDDIREMTSFIKG